MTFADKNGILNINESELNQDEKNLLSVTVKDRDWLKRTNFIGILNPQFKEVYIDVINNSTHDASANWRGFKSVGINYGLVLNLHKIAGLLLNTKELFNELGTDKELYNIEELLPLFDMLLNDTSNLRVRTKPISPERVEVVAIVMHIALTFIIGHELCHTINHGKAFEKLTKKGQVSEYFDANFFSNEIILDLRSLELDADRFGAINSYWATVVLWQAKGSPLKKYFSGPSYIWIISILGLFFSFEKSNKDSYPEKNSYHPAPKIRQNFCMNYIYDILKSSNSIELFEGNFHPDFASTIVNRTDNLEYLFNVSSEEKSIMEKEYSLITSNLRHIQKKYQLHEY